MGGPAAAEALGMTAPRARRVPDFDARGPSDTLGKRQVRLDFAPDASACREARDAVRNLCLTPRLTPLADDAALLASEAMSNAIRHATRRISLRATCSEAEILVSVSDDGLWPDAELIPRQPGDGAESGRGLFVIDKIASEWGASDNAQGTTVWFLLR